LPDESVIHCPLCGNKVPYGVAKCPICATELQQVIAKRSVARVAAVSPSDDFLRRELPKMELPDTKHNCPLCALELKGVESKCPRCGIPLTAEPIIAPQGEMVECPECGAFAPADSKSCPKCGVGFEEGPEVPGPPPIEEVPPPPGPIVPVPEPFWPTPEVVTRLPAPAPTTGQGLVNGRGAINGTGLVNGTGMINGTKGVGRLTASAQRRAMLLTKWQFLAVLVALVIVIPTFIYLSYSNETTPVAIDGSFKEWADEMKYGVFNTSGSGDTDILQWAVDVKTSSLYLYLKVAGSIMSSSEVNSYYLFVDSDNSESTGYAVSGIGAEYLLELDGWNSSVQSTSLSEFGSVSDQYDWNSWQHIGSLNAMASGSELEASAELPIVPSENAKFMLLSKDSLDRSSVSYTVPAQGGILVIKQEPGPAVFSSGIVSQAASSQMLRLRLSCDGKAGSVQTISITATGANLVASPGHVDVALGEEQVVDVAFDTSTSTPGTVVSAEVVASGVQSSFKEVVVVGPPVKAYVAAPPSAIQIDGAFGDWVGRTTLDSDPLQVDDENIDVSATGAANDTLSAAFYVRVVGEMCSGSYVPFIKEKPSGGGGGGGIVIPTTRKTGEDVLMIYIDTDLSNATGYQMSLSTKLIGADRKIEVRGLNGEIVSRSMYQYSGSQWTPVSTSISAAKDGHAIELSVSPSVWGGSIAIDYIIQTTNWRGWSDLATSDPQGTRAFSSEISPSAGTEAWAIDSTINSNLATAMSYQRKLIYDGTYFWSFFDTGADTVFRFSTDGITWSTPASDTAFTTKKVFEVSIWYDSTNRTIFEVGDGASVSQVVHVRKGVVNVSTPAIDWDAEVDWTVSTLNLASKNSFICKDAAGYVWVASVSKLTGGVNPTYNIATFRSGVVDNVTSPTSMGSMLPTDADTAEIKAMILPAGTGSNVWGIYTYSGNVASRKHTGTGLWGSETRLLAGSGTAFANTLRAPPSAVVDSKGVVHVVYGDCSEVGGVGKPRILYSHNNTGTNTWTSGLNLDTGIPASVGDLYPTITLESSTRTLYTFWARMDTTDTPLTIMAKKNESGTWSWLATSSDTTSSKEHLTSIYSVTGSLLVCWQWTQNTNGTGTLQTVFDKIPEFGDISLPVISILIVLFVAGERTRARRRR